MTVEGTTSLLSQEVMRKTNYLEKEQEYKLFVIDKASLQAASSQSQNLLRLIIDNVGLLI